MTFVKSNILWLQKEGGVIFEENTVLEKPENFRLFKFLFIFFFSVI